jgi:hypothetical protein
MHAQSNALLAARGWVLTCAECAGGGTQLVALAPGLQRLGGLMVTDAVSGRTFDADAIGDILVRRGPAHG